MEAGSCWLWLGAELGVAKAALGSLLLEGSLPPEAPDLASGKPPSRGNHFSLFTSPDASCCQILTPPPSLQTGVLHMVHGHACGCCK